MLDVSLEANFNLSLIDPAKWGWSAGGKVVEVQTPHENLRRRSRKLRGASVSQKTSRRGASGHGPLSILDLDSIRGSLDGNTNNLPSEETSSGIDDSISNENESSRSNEMLLTILKPTPSALAKSPFKPEIWMKIQQGVLVGCPVCQREYQTAHPDGRHQKHAEECPRNMRKRMLKASQYHQQRNVDLGQSSKPMSKKLCVSLDNPSVDVQHAILEEHANREPVNLDFKSVQFLQGQGKNKLQVISLVPTATPSQSDQATTLSHGIPPSIANDPKEDGFVDMYTYHLGREGLELCDTPNPVDSGYNVPIPRTKFLIQVDFPLNEERTEMWKEQIEWDLEDERMLTPITFAVRVAHDFGLSFADTMELASSIEEQINVLRGLDAVVYPETVIPLIDPATGQNRLTVGPSYFKGRPCHLYGSILSDARGSGGMTMKMKKASAVKPIAMLAATTPATVLAAVAQTPSALVAGNADCNFTKVVEKRAGGRPRVSEDAMFQFKTPPAFRDEIIKRAKQECQFTSPIMQLKWNHVCHLCNAKKQQTAMFPCENPSHIYCQDHCKSELKLDLTRGLGGRVPAIDFCPICCCTCSCVKCNKRLDQVSHELQRRSIAHGGTSPSETILEHVLHYCTGKLQPTRKASGSSHAAGKSFTDKYQEVAKVPLSDFPREMCGARDLEPGTETDYRTVFTENGAYLLEPHDPVFLVSSSSVSNEAASSIVQEDGNVDYCQVCNQAGDIICCDFCPRAFHATCMEVNEATIYRDDGNTSGRWECPTCKREKKGIPEDFITGRGKFENEEGLEKDCLAAVCEGFAGVEGRSAEETALAMKVLSVLLEMVQHLMEYDFGYMFQEPVDINAIPEYATVVRKPMDLGTIADHLVDGYYAEMFDIESKGWGSVIAQVLKDVELVWHNCFTFNFEGSAIYRMAEVCSRRARNIMAKSLENLLDGALKKDLADFVTACEIERAPIANTSSLFQVMPKSKNRIRVAWAPGGKCHTVAIVDPETGRLCKLYSTLKSAWTAAYFLSSLGHATEWPSISDYTIRSCIRRSKDDPKLTLFGYRWLFYDDLRSGKVTFGVDAVDPKDHSWVLRHCDDCFVQLTDFEGITFSFSSIAEAVSFYGLPSDASLADLKTRLEEGPINEWLPFVGLSWRKVPKDGSVGTDPLTRLGNQREMPPSPGCSSHLYLDKAPVVKLDSLSGCPLVGFDSVNAAYQDWRRVYKCSPVRLKELDLSWSVFKNDFLDGSSTVDGLVWKTTSHSPNQEMLELPVEQNVATTAVATSLRKRMLEESCHENPDSPRVPMMFGAMGT